MSAGFSRDSKQCAKSSNNLLRRQAGVTAVSGNKMSVNRSMNHIRFATGEKQEYLLAKSRKGKFRLLTYNKELSFHLQEMQPGRK
jgi:hypothetical protein